MRNKGFPRANYHRFPEEEWVSHHNHKKGALFCVYFSELFIDCMSLMFIRSEITIRSHFIQHRILI